MNRRNVTSQSRGFWQQMKDMWAWIRVRPVPYAAVQICGTILAVAIVTHMLMTVCTRHYNSRIVPDFRGLTTEDAEYYAHKQGLKLVVNDSLFMPQYKGGVILDQIPRMGVEVKSGRKIYLTINSFGQKKVVLPYVAGRSLRQARKMLEASGFEIGELIYVEDMATNYVLAEFAGAQRIWSGSNKKLPMGSSITLHVGVQAGQTVESVPSVIGASLDAAKSALWDMGLNVGKVTYDTGLGIEDKRLARVYEQSVPAGSGCEYGHRVDLNLTVDGRKISKGEETAAEQLKTAAESADSLKQATEEAAASTDNTKKEGFFE